jgi:hypothetical protein
LLDQPEISLSVSRAFSTGHGGDLRSLYVHNGRAKAKAAANNVTATKIGAARLCGSDSASITIPDRDRARKLARLRRGFLIPL